MESYQVKQFESECKVLAQIHHPNIVQFLGVFYSGGSQIPLLIMEYLEMNVFKCIEDYGPWPEEVSYSVLHDVAMGLRYLHESSPPIIHRDLSSKNVMLTRDMTAKISDLGGAKLLQRNMKMTKQPGTEAYMPPEASLEKYDISLDIFSFGVLVLNIFCAQWPRKECQPEMLRELSKVALHEKANMCLHKNPPKRPKAADIAVEIEKIQSILPKVPDRLSIIQQIEKCKSDIMKKENDQCKEQTMEVLESRSCEIMVRSIQFKIFCELTSLHFFLIASTSSTRNTLL